MPKTQLQNNFYVVLLKGETYVNLFIQRATYHGQASIYSLQSN